MAVLRFVRLLTLAVWIGSIVFFAAVLAPAAFSFLPAHPPAGVLESLALVRLHWIGIICGVLFLLCGLAEATQRGGASMILTRDLLLVVMLGLTLYAQFGPARQISKRQSGASTASDPVAQGELDPLQRQIGYLESGVLACGVVVVALIARDKRRDDDEY